MSAMLQDRAVLRGPASGGTAGRRVVIRWARRLLRREWRQQMLVLALLVLTVGAASFGVAAAYNLAPLPSPQLGSADYLLQFAGSGTVMTADVAAARKAFGTIEVIGHQFVPIPGSAQSVEFRALSPGGPYSGPMLALVQGRYPSGAGQAAVTSGLAQALQVHIGSVLSLPGHHQRVTGIVENPSDLKDQFALVPPSAAGPAQGVTVLLDASPSSFTAFRDTFHGQLLWQARGAGTQAAVAAGALGAVTVLMVLVSLVAAAAFAVIAARRQRQLGMLAAIGATPRQLRMVMVAGGALVGIIAAVTGTVIGLAAWFVAAPRLQVSAGHRIDEFAVPWPLVGLGMLLAILTAAAAAWWPARAASRVPVVNALSARPLEPRPAHRTAIMAVPLIVLGLACLALANQTTGPLIIAGALAMALGISFISPLSIRVLTAAAGRRAPVAVRLALRDLSRYQARSAAALAAISLALGIAVAIMISLAADTTPASAGNLPGNQMLIWIGQPGQNQLVPMRTPAELSTLDAAVHRIARSLGGAAVVPLDMPVNPASRPQPGGQQPVVSLNAPVDQAAGRNGVYRSVDLYVATPAVLHLLGINPATIGPASDILTVQAGQDVLTTITNATNATNVQRIHVPDYGSEPTSLITVNGLRREHWTQIRSGWMINSARPLHAAEVAAAREVAARSGLVIESRNTQASLATIRTLATVAGALIALGVLALTVGLIRAEAAGDLRTLTAIGAAGSTRRTLTATTAGTLALLGALLGSGAAYLALAAGHRSDISVLSQVPVLDLILTIAGVPAGAALAGWILAGRRPPSVARQPLD
jgi:putative ABC transport system permease protein